MPVTTTETDFAELAEYRLLVSQGSICRHHRMPVRP